MSPVAQSSTLRHLLDTLLLGVPEPLALEVLRGAYARLHAQVLRAVPRPLTRGEQVLRILAGAPPMRAETVALLLNPERPETYSRSARNLAQITLSRLKAQGKVINPTKGFWQAAP